MTVQPAGPCVYIVDDDRHVLTALSRLLSSAGYSVRAFDSPVDFLREHDPEVLGCAILDVGMSEVDGLALQESLVRQDHHRPIIFVTGHDDANTGVRAIKAGALEYLTKPTPDTVLLAAVANAIDIDIEGRRQRGELRKLRRMYSRLTAREVEVLRLVARGLMNKQIAFELGIVEKTVKVHRARAMQKLQVHSLAALIRVADKLGISAPERTHVERPGEHASQHETPAE